MTGHIDGKAFKDLFKAGAHRVAVSRDYLNSINVFPVPDGDTGSNMAETLTNAAECLETVDDSSLASVLETLSTKLRMEAKGNSGVILSEFFYGMFLKLKQEERVHPERFVEALTNGKDMAYAALAEPKEGTILTIIRKASDRLHHAKEDMRDMIHTVERLVESARLAVEETKGEMEVLKKNKVVDSGAHGFLLFWEGALGCMKGEIDASTILKPIKRIFTTEQKEDIKYRFCTEALVKGEGMDRTVARAELSKMGDSLIVTGDGSILKVHVHTNDPQAVFALLGAMGTLVKTKADDMIAQNTQKAANEKKAAVRVLTDSTCDLDLELMEEKEIEMAPLRVMFGEETLRDRVDITVDEFYERLQRSPILPRTSLPAAADFMQGYEHIAPYCEKILAVYLSSTLSGTWQAGRKRGEEFGGDKVVAYDSGQASMAMGLMTLEAANMAEKGEPLDKIIARLDEIKGKVSTYFTVDTLEFLAKNGRIGLAKKGGGPSAGAKTDFKVFGRAGAFVRKGLWKAQYDGKAPGDP
ncbi:MAG: DegV family EDD domain-containing protein [Nitrospinae bacterium]|nr:DegV family EDD domain-containing protein [Nitrospinota bacterium]